MDAPRVRPPGRRRRVVPTAGLVLVLALVVIGLVGVSVAAQRGPTATPTPSVTLVPTPTARPSDPASVPASGGGATGYLFTPADLADRTAAAAATTEPYATARQDLLDFADQAVQAAPRPVVNLQIPGTVGPFVDDTAAAYGLALAYATTGDLKYATAARDYINAWVGTTKTLVNACPEDGSCQTSLIVARVVPGFVFAADLIRPSGVLSEADEAALRAWLKGLILPELPLRDGNWGDAGNFSRAVISDYLGDVDGFAKALDEWRRRMDAVPADGHLPDEVRRGHEGILYTQEALQYKVATARLAEMRGTDLWSYRGKLGGTLRGAIDLLARYWSRPGDWPYDSDPLVPSPGSMWELAYQHWREPSWRAIFAADRPFGDGGHSAVRWTTMTNGIPLE